MMIEKIIKYIIDFIGQLIPSLSSLNFSSGIFFVFFGLVIYFLYKVVSLGIRLALLGILSGSFPFISNKFLGTNIPTTPETVLIFILSGVGIFSLGWFLRKIFGLRKWIF